MRTVLSSISVQDTAICEYSPGGRTPLTHYLLARFGSRHCNAMELTNFLLEFLGNFAHVLSLEQYQAVFRFLTFEALSMTHTCGPLPPQYFVQLTTKTGTAMQTLSMPTLLMKTMMCCSESFVRSWAGPKHCSRRR
ncbi:uncharacterized protein B0I36DRAFT_331972 [Microdochium trichocladiopsis]|uniref:Uncharacterized protein n=1 Tax=Microdochium trichocladiopsis TaxID=1682393 RepID=A0A9P8XXP1_9PEZI|nr:uncharacterized protein B0I36DRAFT_331972 [Microdochium trichocladiopsis]KAH7024736.1 hypothetical protein B0I36DRAFT_331972 [Microdochium trichocladiopsis]